MQQYQRHTHSFLLSKPVPELTRKQLDHQQLSTRSELATAVAGEVDAQWNTVRLLHADIQSI